MRENRAILDWWLMKMFPGKTPEELDGINIFRVLRVKDVENIMEIERRKEQYLSGVLSVEDLSPLEWKLIALHERLVQGEEPSWQNGFNGN